jgi:putative ABC transport system substrate-binding protein
MTADSQSHAPYRHYPKIEVLAARGRCHQCGGFTAFEYGISGKWLELLKEIAPHMTRTAVLRDPALAGGIGQFAAIQSMASSSAVALSARQRWQRSATRGSSRGFGGLPSRAPQARPKSLWAARATHNTITHHLWADGRVPAGLPSSYRAAAVGGCYGVML